MAFWNRKRPLPAITPDVLEAAIRVAQVPETLIRIPTEKQPDVDKVAKALTKATAMPKWGNGPQPIRPPKMIPAQYVAQQAYNTLAPSSTITPEAIEQALTMQGIDFVEPFAPGRPLTPYYGYNRRPREWNYEIGRNITTEPRSSRIPFEVLQEVIQGYDIAQICIRHIINDLRSMGIRFRPADDVTEDVSADIKAAKKFLKKPDGHQPFSTWLTEWAWDVYRYDAGTLFKLRNAAGEVVGLKVVDGTTMVPLVDYYGDVPEGPAPAYEQFIMGIPWVWLEAKDVVYQPMWPLPESPYGLAPIESVLLNANTDVRLQWYFLNFFTAGNVPEAFATAPPDMSDPDSLAEFQEVWNSWTVGDQSKRYGLRYVPAGTQITPYKPQQFDPNVAEYVMKRTVAAFGLVPQDLGFTEDVNKASSSTQVDVQFRISTLPNTGYFEDIINDILQNDLGLRVQIEFDTGREKEDRLVEAQAHQIYVSIGAESPDEVRDKVLNLPVEADGLIPRFFNARTGLIPLASIAAVSGDTDPQTGAPKPGSISPQQFIWPGQMTPDPGFGAQPTSASNQAPGTVSATGHKVNPPQTNKPPKALPSGKPTSQTQATPQPARPRQKNSGQGWGVQGVDVGRGNTQAQKAVDDKAVLDEIGALARYVRKSAQRGRWREFDFSALPPELAEMVNELGRQAFEKATDDQGGDGDPKGPARTGI